LPSLLRALLTGRVASARIRTAGSEGSCEGCATASRSRVSPHLSPHTLLLLPLEYVRTWLMGSVVPCRAGFIPPDGILSFSEPATLRSTRENKKAGSFDALDKALIVFKHVANSTTRKRDHYRRVDLIIARWPSFGAAIVGVSFCASPSEHPSLCIPRRGTSSRSARPCAVERLDPVRAGLAKTRREAVRGTAFDFSPERASSSRPCQRKISRLLVVAADSSLTAGVCACEGRTKWCRRRTSATSFER